MSDIDRLKQITELQDLLAAANARLAAVWDECATELYDLGWLHDYAQSDALARNPYRKEKA